MSILKTATIGSLFTLLSAGAALAATPPCQVQGGRVQAALTTNASTMDPILSTTNASRQIAIHLFESLASMDSNYQVIPQLAQEWSRSDDGLTYTFRFAQGVKFHNGKTMTADDVKASLDRFIKISPGANRFKNVKSVEIVDPQTIRINLTAIFRCLNNLAMPSPIVAIFPKEIVEKYGDKEVRGEDVIGTGPYQLKEWRPDVGVKMVKFKDYTPDLRFDGPTGFGGAKTACVDEVNFLPVTEDASRVAGLQTGDFDFAEAVPITSVPQLETDPNLSMEILKPKWAVVLELDHKNPLMQKLPFRKALLAALNMDQIMRASALGVRITSASSRASSSRSRSSGTLPSAARCTTSPTRLLVASLLKEAGYNNQPVIYLTNQNYGWMYKASQAIAAQWQAMGINAKLEVMDWPSQIKRAQTSNDWAINHPVGRHGSTPSRRSTYSNAAACRRSAIATRPWKQHLRALIPALR